MLGEKEYELEVGFVSFFSLGISFTLDTFKVFQIHTNNSTLDFLDGLLLLLEARFSCSLLVQFSVNLGPSVFGSLLFLEKICLILGTSKVEQLTIQQELVNR